jgi:hypothetical protein
MSDRQGSESASGPSKPRLALTLGVVGHRPNRLPEAARDSVTAAIGRALDAMAAAARDTGARHGRVFAADDSTSPITVLTGLAEGADRMAALQALARGQSQSAVLAFAADEFEKDFEAEASRREFRDLVSKTAECLELPGRREAEDRSYEAAGVTILDNSDLLLAVWDGGASAGRGGTTELIERAVRDNIPIVHVDAAGETPTRILWSGLARQAIAATGNPEDLPAAPLEESLGAVVDELVRPPSSEEEAAKLEVFLAERWRPRNYCLVFPWLMCVLGIRKLRSSDFRPPGPGDLETDFRRSGGGMLDAGVFDAAAAAYGWADALAVRYAQVFRGAYIANFILGALAVILAASSLIGKDLLGVSKLLFLGAELVCIGGVLATTWIGQRRNWHGRWLESREVAERLRVAMPMWLIGQRANRFSGEEPAWTGWYVRAHLRALGLASGALTKERLAAIKELLSRLIADQCGYHLANSAGLSKAEHRIERLGEIAFFITGVVVLAAGTALLLDWHPTKGWLYAITAATAGLPALGAAGYGIRLIGDFEGVAQRSERTGEALKTIGDSLAVSPAEMPTLRQATQAVSASMLGDVAGWRLASETRKLAIPC